MRMLTAISPLSRVSLFRPLTVVLTGLLLTIGAAKAQDYPSRPVTLVVPFAPGGNLDVVARILAPALEKALGQPVIVDNRAGAGGTIGASYVARAETSGHTLLVTTPNAIVVLPKMNKTPYKLESFQAVGLAATTALVVVVKANSQFKDVASLLAFARANPGKVAAGHAGPGTTNHMALMEFEAAAKVKFNAVPYKGSAPALVDLMGGQTDFVVDQLTGSASYIQAGTLRALAVMSAERDTALPKVSTLRESGLKDFSATTSTGLLAPAGTPPAVVETLNRSLRQALADERVIARLLTVGGVARASSALEFSQLLQREDGRAQLLADAGKLKAD